MNIKRIIATGGAVALMLTSAIPAFGANGLTVSPFTYSPLGLTGLYGGEFTPNQGPSAHAQWKRVDGNWELQLTKNADLQEVAAGGAQVHGVKGWTLSTLGFDMKDGTYCGAGAPRFNVRLTDGKLFFFGCVYGETSAAATGWTHVNFTNADAFAQDGVSVWPGFGTAEVESVTLIQDEPGQAVLDNITVNTTVVGGPGNVK